MHATLASDRLKKVCRVEAPTHLNNERRKVGGWVAGWLGGWVAPKSPVLPPGWGFEKARFAGFS